MKILVLNSGSSSQKACLYEISGAPPKDPPQCLWQAKIEWSDNGADVRITASDAVRLQQRVPTGSRKEITEKVLSDLWKGTPQLLPGPSAIDVVGHRIVHGGEKFSAPAIVTAEVKDAIRRASEFAPLHNPAGLEGIEIIEQILGSVPQVAVFDTGFHRHMADAAATYPGPYEWLSRGIRRYGFHGINHQYSSQRAAGMLGREEKSLKLITCHLGNGCSLAAIDGGRSVDTTMGFTPLDGLMMGTRSGSIDPGIITYLMRQDHLDAKAIDDLLNKNSGLAGISGVSNDMREIVSAMKQGNARAKLAFDIFIHRLVSLIGSMFAILGGADALVFTAGIGENSADVRAAACAHLEFLSLKLDANKNSHPSGDCDISVPDSRVRILIIHAEEDWSIARSCFEMLS
jgi:acetate kinase